MANESEQKPTGPLERFFERLEELRQGSRYYEDYKRLVLVLIFHGFAFQILFLSPEFIQEKSPTENIGNFLVGINYALYQTVSIILVLMLSRVSDEKKQRKGLLVIIVLFGTIVGFIQSLVAFLEIIPLYIILFMFFMATIYGSDILIVVLITEYFPKTIRGFAVGLMASVSIVGWASGALLSGFLYENVGMGFCFFLSAAAMLCSFFFLLGVRDVGVGAKKGVGGMEWEGGRSWERKKGEWEEGGNEGEDVDWEEGGGWEEEKDQTFFEVLGEGMGVLYSQMKALPQWITRLLSINSAYIDRYLFGFRKRRQITMIFFATLLVSIGSGMINPFTVNFLEDRGVSVTIIGFVFAIFGVIIFLPINRFAAGWLCDRFTAKKVFSYAVISYIFLWGIFNLSIITTDDNTVILAIYAFPVWPFLYIGYQLFVSDYTSRGERARGLSSVQFAMGVGYVMGALIGAILLFYGFSHEMVFRFSMIFIFFAALKAYDILKSPLYDAPDSKSI